MATRQIRISGAGIVAAIAAVSTFVSAAQESGDPQVHRASPGADSVTEAQSRLEVSAPKSDDGVETGNLKEAGARELFSIADYERAVASSRNRPVLIFKHSTECEVSGGAYRRLAQWMKVEGSKAPSVYLVKVIERKPVSQEIAARTGVKHESPQVILLADGKPVWNADHEAITEDAVKKALGAQPGPVFRSK